MPIEIIEIEGVRHYCTPFGPLPSVNTILDATEPEEDRERLEAWKRKTRNHEQISQDALARGEALHQAAATFLELGWVDQISPEVAPWWRSLSQYLETITRTATVNHPVYAGSQQGTELPVYSSLGYAGTLDWIGEKVPLELTLADFKSSRWYKKPQFTERYKVQVSAYRLALEELLEIEVDHVEIAIAIPDRTPQIIQLTATEMADYDLLWLDRLHQFQGQGRIAV